MDKQNPEDVDVNINVDLSKINLQSLFSIELVLKKLLSYFPFSDKANLRLVCKQLEVLSRATWRNDSTLQIGGTLVLQNGDGDNTSSDSNRLTMKHAVEKVLHVNYNVASDPWNWSEYPFRKLKINGDHQLGTMDDVDISFWNFFGPSVKYLHLNGVSFGPGGATQMHRILCEFTPNLKEFVYTQRDTSARIEPVLADKIIRQIQPNLTSIIINFTNVDYAKVHRDRDSAQNIIINNTHLRGDNIGHLVSFRDANGVPRIRREFRVGVMQEDFYDIPHPPDLPSPFETYEREMFRSMFPFDWKLLFETFPNVKKIALGYNEPSRHNLYYFLQILERFLLDLINGIGQVRKERPNTLNIDTCIGLLCGEGSMAKFCELSLPIRCFTGKFERKTVSEFHKFLTSHEKTLEALTINGFGYDQELRDVKDIWLPAGLTYLQMDRPWGNCMDFLAHVPNLETLIFNNEANSMEETNFNSAFKHQRVQCLQKLKEFRCKTLLSEETFNKIVSLMPNLKKLTVGMDFKRWMIASLAWNQLEHLEVLQSRWNEDLSLDEKLFVRFADRFENLKVFAIENSCGEDSTHLRDLSIYEGFLKMPQLRRVKVKFLPSVSKRAIAALEEKIQHLEI